jgi:hypothetical protein
MIVDRRDAEKKENDRLRAIADCLQSLVDGRQ